MNDAMSSAPDASPPAHTPGPSDCRAREILDLVASKWALAVVDTLGAGPQRFNELRRSIAGISQRMLTVTLRELERNGILTRTVYAVMPPNVTYELTTIGRTLLQATRPLVQWSHVNIAAIDAARAEFEGRQPIRPTALRSCAQSGRSMPGAGGA